MVFVYWVNYDKNYEILKYFKENFIGIIILILLFLVVGDRIRKIFLGGFYNCYILLRVLYFFFWKEIFYIGYLLLCY